MSLQKLFFNVFLFLFAFSTQAQTGKIYGYISDKGNNEPLIGATVLIVDTGGGTVSDIDGSYELMMQPGNYTLEISYSGYQQEKVTELEIKGNENIKLDFHLSTATQNLEVVVVTATAKRTSAVNLLLLQQKSISAVTGISSDQMKLSPDRNTADVLKRVSGASVQDNKFVVIRGLSDRYNGALINGLSLPSTEPDKRAFSFDIFPSNLLDNLIIYKTATPDLPGEWAGGLVQLNTKEIPQEFFSNLNLSFGFNSQSTFKNYQKYKGGSTDWLGIDDGTRGLPGDLDRISIDTFNSSKANQAKYSALFPNDWGIMEESSMRPPLSLQFSAGTSFGNLGVVGAITYSNSPKIVISERGDYDGDGRRYQYFDRVTNDNVSLGGLVNLAYKLSSRSRIQFNNTFSLASNDQFLSRAGDNMDNDNYIRSNAYLYTQNSLYTGQLLGEHAFTSRQIKLNWGIGYNRITRDVPSYRRMLYTTPSYEDTIYFAQVPFGNPSPNYAGNFFSTQQEDFLTGKIDLTFPYFIGNKKGNLKFGGLYEDKERSFDARLFGFLSSFGALQDGLNLLPIGEIFAPKNIGTTGFLMKESTDRSDSYEATSKLLAGYGMVEQALTDRLRFIGGARVESFHQTMDSYKIKSNTPVNVDTTITNILPSAHLIYGLGESTNIRASLARTTSRPNFREIAPFSFFDFFLDAGINGNPNLLPTLVWNADLRFETYSKNAQYLAVSAFYKKFDNPIELVFNNTQGAGTRNFDYENVPSAIALGAELEGRMGLGRIAGFLNDVTVFGNLSYIFSEVELSQELKDKEVAEHPLFGQSPYIVNFGVNYNHRESGLGATVLFNRIGRRIWLVGRGIYDNTFEAPRSVMDFQVTKNIGKYLELKVTIGDILNQRAYFYQDVNDNDKYDDTTLDGLIISNRFGTNFSLGLSYSFIK